MTPRRLMIPTTAANLAAYAPRYAALLRDTIRARCIVTGPEYLRLDADAVAVAAVVAHQTELREVVR